LTWRRLLNGFEIKLIKIIINYFPIRTRSTAAAGLEMEVNIPMLYPVNPLNSSRALKSTPID